MYFITFLIFFNFLTSYRNFTLSLMPTTEDMTSTDNWAHFQPNILLNCATAHGEVPEEAEDPELAKQMQEAADPYEPRLKSISAD